MAGLLSKIGKGLGKGMVEVGTWGMEEARQKRLAEMKRGWQKEDTASAQAFQKEQTASDQAFTLERDETQFNRSMELEKTKAKAKAKPSEAKVYKVNDKLSIKSVGGETFALVSDYEGNVEERPIKFNNEPVPDMSDTDLDKTVKDLISDAENWFQDDDIDWDRFGDSETALEDYMKTQLKNGATPLDVIRDIAGKGKSTSPQPVDQTTTQPGASPQPTKTPTLNPDQAKYDRSIEGVMKKHGVSKEEAEKMFQEGTGGKYKQFTYSK